MGARFLFCYYNCESDVGIEAGKVRRTEKNLITAAGTNFQSAKRETSVRASEPPTPQQ
jgi:hypothetical protein